MKIKIIFLVLFLCLCIQFIFINRQLDKNINNQIEINPKIISTFEMYSNLKNIENLEIIEIKKEVEKTVGNVMIKGDYVEVKNALKSLDTYKITNYKIKSDNEELEVELYIV